MVELFKHPFLHAAYITLHWRLDLELSWTLYLSNYDWSLFIFFVDYVELVLAAENTPNNGNVLNDQCERDDEQRTKDAEA